MLSRSLDKNLVELIRRSITIIFKSLIATLEAPSRLRGIYLSSLHLSGKVQSNCQPGRNCCFKSADDKRLEFPALYPTHDRFNMCAEVYYSKSKPYFYGFYICRTTHRQLCSTQQESWMKTTFSSLLRLKCSCFLHESVKFSYISHLQGFIFVVFLLVCAQIWDFGSFFFSTSQYFCSQNSQITDPGLVFEIFMFEYCFRFQWVKKSLVFKKIFDTWSKISTTLNI